MSVRINDLKEKGVFKTVIEPKYAYEEGSEPFQAWDGAEVTLREVNSQEALVLYGAGTEGNTNSHKELAKLLPKVIVDHNFVKESGEPASAEQVAELLMESSSVYTYLLQEWQNAVPLARMNNGSSDKSDASGSQGDAAQQ
jgi:hypothetical protein